MRIESSVTSITWIPSEAIKGMTKLPFELGIAHYDDPPPDKLDDIDALRERDAFREANVLHAYVEVEDGKIVTAGHLGRGLIGVTRLKLGPKELTFPAVKYPVLQSEPEIGPNWVRFTQTARGRSRATGCTTTRASWSRSPARSISTPGTARSTGRRRPGARATGRRWSHRRSRSSSASCRPR